MDKDLTQKAISYALKGNWKQAIDSNKEILKTDATNIDALNRLSRAYAEIGEIDKARKTASKVLKINQYDTIATKSLEKWANLKKGASFNTGPVNPDLFLEEPGKTKIVNLLHLGDISNVIAKLDSGDEVVLDNHSHRLSVTTLNGNYIGKLPDDLSAKLKKFIAMGNTYSAYIKSSDKKEVKVFIREVHKSAKLKDTASFPAEKIDYVSFTPPELVHDKDLVMPGDSDEEV